MSKLIRKLSKALNSSKKDARKDVEVDDEVNLQVDAIPTESLAFARPIEDHHEAEEEVLESGEGPLNIGQERAALGSNQANQFNSPNQTVYQFNHANGIHIGNNFTINQNITQEQQQEGVSDAEVVETDATATKEQKISKVDSTALRKKYPKTRTIEKLLKSDKEIDHPEMDVVSTHLGEDWRSVARDLGFSNGEIDHFYEDNFAFGVKEVRKGFLLFGSPVDGIFFILR